MFLRGKLIFYFPVAEEKMEQALQALHTAFNLATEGDSLDYGFRSGTHRYGYAV